MTYDELMQKDPHFVDWDLEISGKPYQVVRYTGYNNEDYACYEILPTYERVRNHFIPPNGDIEVMDCHGVRGNSPTWEIKQQKFKRCKTKWNETSVRFSCLTKIYRNDVSFFVFGGDENYAYHKAKATLVEYLEGPVNFHSRFWREELLNKKILYNGQAAIIKRVNTNPFQIWIEPVEGRFAPPPSWDNDNRDFCNREEWNSEYAEGLIIEDILRESIDWFPDD